MDFLLQNPLLVMLLVMLVVMMIFSSRSRKKMMARQEEQQRQLAESLVPGAWVKTAFGFWGRYVDQDGDVVILETANGTETYWDRQVIREVGQPPFASEEAEDVQETEQAGEDPAPLGLESPIETDEPKN